MRIAYLAAGAGDMYCGSCLQSNTLVRALRASGEDALLVPMYTPLRADEPIAGREEIAFGGVNVYLQQASPIFGFMPATFERWLDRPGLLRWLGRRAGSTRPETLGPLTLSMLQGENGRQRKELDKLVEVMRREVQPEVIHLANVLLVGVADRLGRELGVPVVASLAGEDGFLDRIPSPYGELCRRELSARCARLDALVAMNHYYADFMAEYLGVPRARIRVIPPGLSLEGYPAPDDGDDVVAETAEASQQAERSGAGAPVTVGYFSRICEEKGLHLLVEAFRLLCDDDALPPLKLHAAGSLTAADRSYLRRIERRLRDCDLLDRFCYHGELDRAGKIVFLQSLDVLAAPSLQRECKGLAVLEAWAAGVPCVLPEHGAFGEMIGRTGGGRLCRPNDAESLAAELKALIVNRPEARELGRRAQRVVHQQHRAETTARQTAELYRELLNAKR
jgi:glycosyltransferase involved in cell wall biosynthesis